MEQSFPLVNAVVKFLARLQHPSFKKKNNLIANSPRELFRTNVNKH